MRDCTGFIKTRLTTSGTSMPVSSISTETAMRGLSSFLNLLMRPSPYKAGFRSFGMHDHTQFWKKHDGKNSAKGYGTMVVKSWCWYQNWIAFVISELTKR